jgi:hypothetical protein
MPQLNTNSGIPALLDDLVDKVTRYYIRCIKTNVGNFPSFVYTIANAYRYPFGANHPLCADGKDIRVRFIRFTLREGAVDMVTAATVLDAKENSRTLSVLKERVVILGGTYRDFDRHFTPIGTQRGAIVLANALQSELLGPSVEAPAHWELFFLEAIASTLLVLGFHVLALSPALVLIGGSALTLVLALAFSYISYSSLSGLMIFAPTLFAVLLLEIYEYVRHQSIVKAAHLNGDRGT